MFCLHRLALISAEVVNVCFLYTNYDNLFTWQVIGKPSSQERTCFSINFVFGPVTSFELRLNVSNCNNRVKPIRSGKIREGRYGPFRTRKNERKTWYEFSNEYTGIHVHVQVS